MPLSQLDAFDRNADTLSSPARHAFAITPDDTEALPRLPKAIIVGGDGVLTLRAVDSDSDVAIPVSAGQLVPVRASFVRATGTSAGNLVGLA